MTINNENEKNGAPGDAKPREDREPDGKLYEKLTPFRSAAVYTGIPMTLLACMIVGYLIGAFIEKRCPTGGVFVAIFSMLGVAAGFREILRLLKKNNK